MVAISPPPVDHKWGTLSFVSTLYLRPVLDLLLADVPSSWHPEVRLGLQEALVNAAKHGNKLDPAKKVSVRFAAVGDAFWWIIADQGAGFQHPCCCEDAMSSDSHSHCGRGLYIIYQVFDEIQWQQGGRELHLCKRIRRQGLPRFIQ